MPLETLNDIIRVTESTKEPNLQQDVITTLQEIQNHSSGDIVSQRINDNWNYDSDNGFVGDASLRIDFDAYWTNNKGEDEEFHTQIFHSEQSNPLFSAQASTVNFNTFQMGSYLFAVAGSVVDGKPTLFYKPSTQGYVLHEVVGHGADILVGSDSFNRYAYKDEATARTVTNNLGWEMYKEPPRHIVEVGDNPAKYYTQISTEGEIISGWGKTSGGNGSFYYSAGTDAYGNEYYKLASSNLFLETIDGVTKVLDRNQNEADVTSEYSVVIGGAILGRPSLSGSENSPFVGPSNLPVPLDVPLDVITGETIDGYFSKPAPSMLDKALDFVTGKFGGGSSEAVSNIINGAAPSDNGIGGFEEGASIIRWYSDVDGSQVLVVLTGEGSYITTRLWDENNDGNYDYAVQERIHKHAKVEVKGNISTDGLKFDDPEFEVIIDDLVIQAGQIGSILGSSIGNQIAGSNVFAQIAVGSLLKTLGQNLGETFDNIFYGQLDSGNAFSTAIDNIDSDLLSNIKSAGIGSISSFLTGELIKSVIGLDGAIGDVAQTASNAVVGQIVTNLQNLGPVLDVAGNPILNAQGEEIVTGWDSGIADINFSGLIGSYLGSMLAGKVIKFDTIGGQVGSAVGSAIGAYVASKIIGKVTGVVLNALVPGIGAFVGFIVGGLLGSLFGGTPRSGADVLFNPDTGEFGVTNIWSRKGGSKEGASNLASIAAENLNGILAAIGGDVINDGRVSGGTYGTRKSNFTYRVDGGSYGPGDPGKQTIAKTFNGKEDPQKAAELLIEHGVLNALDDLEIAGGDVFLKRALYGALDTLMAGSNVKSSIQGEAINVILGNFQTAADYRTYIENAATINALIAAEPESAFAAGWIITLQRVSEIGLNQRHASDWLGGYNAWAVTNDVQSLGALSINPYVNEAGQSDRRFILTDENSLTRRIYDTVTMSSKDVISGTNGADIITITDDVLSGNAGLTINGEASDGSAFEIGIAATIHGGDGDDVIMGGDLGNDIFGDGGNDTITGGAKDDWIFGGAGNDTLYAGGGNGNYLDGGADNDALYGATGSDWLEGGSGIDILHGNAGDDILSGGTGAGDQLFGGSGDDSYILRLGDGADIVDDKADGPSVAGSGGSIPTPSIKSIIEDRTNGILAYNWAGIDQLTFADSSSVEAGSISGGQDTLILGEGIGLGDISIVRSGTAASPGNDLIIKVIVSGVPTGDQVTLTNWFNDYQRIEKLEFADGQIINIGNFATFTIGTDGADYIIGTSGNDFVHGGGGDDVAFLLWGSDVGIGGTGNDWISGGSGQDIVIGGDQNDVLDGNEGADVIVGGRGSDNLYGGSHNDVLAGDEGDDFVVGGFGDDIFKFSHGDGKDVIFDTYNSDWEIVFTGADGFLNGYYRDPVTLEIKDTGGNVVYDGEDWTFRVFYDLEQNVLKRHLGNGTTDTADEGFDTLEFDVGIDINNIQMTSVGDDLILGIEGYGQNPATFDSITDTITLKEWHRNWGAGGKPIETFSFFNTGQLNAAEIDIWGGGGTDGNDNILGAFDKDWLTGNGGDDTIDGLTGDDILNGNAGQDILIGGVGDDILLGGSGNDILRGGIGGDVLVGDEGFDLISYEGSSIAVNVSLDGFVASTGDAINDEFYGVEGIIGTDHNDILGGDQIGNHLEGGAGNDTLYGQLGDDSYVFNRGDGHDQIFESQHTTEVVVDEEGNLQSPYQADWNLVSTGGFFHANQIASFIYDLTIRNKDDEVIYNHQVSTTNYETVPEHIPVAGWTNGFSQTNNGQEVVRTEISPLDGGDDVIEFGEGISLSNLSFSMSGQDLIITVDNGGGSVTINNFQQDYARIETLEFFDGLSVDLTALNIGAGFVSEPYNSVRFDGVDDYLRFADSSQTTHLAGSFTIEAEFIWNGNLNTNRALLLNKENSYEIGITSNGSIQYALRESGGGWTWIDTGVNVALGEVANIALTYDKTTRQVSFYLNGVQTATTLPLGPITLNQTADDLLLGNRMNSLNSVNTAKLQGDILEVRLWNAALASSDIGAEVVDNTHTNVADLVLDIDFERSGSVDGEFTDNTGGFTATAVNGATTVTADNDFLIGDLSANSLYGYEGDDTLSGSSGNDFLDGGRDNDVLEGGIGADILIGGLGIDTVRYNGSAAGVTVDLSSGNAATGGEAAGDTFDSIENVSGSAFNDVITGNDQDNQIFGLKGDDTLSGGAGADVLKGDAGADQLYGGGGEDNLFGGTGNDTLTGGAGKDSLFGGSGNDILFADDVKLGNGLLLNGTTSSGLQVSNIANMPTGDFTIEMLVKPSSTYGKAIFSYASTKSSNDLLVYNSGSLEIVIGGHSFYTNIALANNTEHRLTVSFDSSEGRLRLYNNGTLLYNETKSSRVGYQLGQNGTLNLGQEQDSIGGGFSASQAFMGEYYRAQVWNEVLSDADIASQTGVFDTPIINFNFVQTTSVVSNVVLDQASGIVGSLLASTSWVESGGDVIADTTSNLLAGEGGSDILYGADGNDQLFGGVGDDMLRGGGGDDLYLFGKNDGEDTIIDGVGANEVAFDTGEVTFDQLWFTRSGNDLIIHVVGGDTQVTLQNYYVGGGTTLSRVVTGTHSLSGDQMDDLVVAMAGQAIGTTSIDIDAARDAVWQDNLFYVDRYVIKGTNSANILTADARVGDFYISGLGGNDTITGGAGNDHLSGGGGSDTIYGEGGDDVIYIDGLSEGSDTIDGGLGIDTILGGEDDDIIGINSIINIENIDGGAGYNKIMLNLWGTKDINLSNVQLNNINLIVGSGSYNGDTIRGSQGHDTIEGVAGSDQLFGEGGDDIFIASDGYSSSYDGGTGFDTILGDAGDNNIGLNSIENIELIDGSGGYNTLSINYWAGLTTLDVSNITLINIDLILGSSRTETIIGTSSGDVIDSGGGRDVLYGNEGDDLFYSRKSGATIYGGNGNDTVDYSLNTSVNAGDINLVTGVADWIGTIWSTETLDSIENIIGTIHNDTITGDANNNTLDGNAGDDVLWGGAGDDVLIGGTGVDVFYGDLGNDTVDYSAVTESLTITIAGGVNIDGGTETFTSIENLKGGSGSDIVIGDDGDNRLDGHIGGDTIQGGLGNDILIGGAGDDSLDGGSGLLDVALFSGKKDDYTIDTVNGRVIDNNITDGNDGTDTVSNIEILRFSDGDISLGIDPNNAPEIGDHQALPDQNTKVTKDYNFTVPGNAFIDQDGDTLNYSATLSDGSPLPTWLTFNSTNRTFTGIPGEALVDTNITIRIKVEDGNGGEKYDDFSLSIIPAGVTVNGTINDDLLVAGDGDDKLYGLAGNDTLSGLIGEDVLDGGTGIDTADYSASDDVVTVDLFNGTATGGHAQGDSFVSIENLKGSDLVGSDVLKGDNNVNIIEGLSGNDLVYGRGGDDILHGNTGNDTLWGDDGNDTLYGESGINSLYGGLGDDMFISANGQDSIFGDGGSDTVDYSPSASGIQINMTAATTAGGYAGNDTLNGVENIIGTDFNDTLIGDGSSNHFQAGLGSDILDGRAGADILDGGSGIDTVTYANSATAVTVDLSGTLTNSGGDAAGDTLLNIENIIGSAFDDEIHGNSIVNHLEGRGGNDKIYGSDGDDLIEGGDGNDELYGGVGKDTLKGGNGDDRIEAGSEGDQLHGGTGNDYLIGGIGDDTYYIGRDTGHDIIDNYDTTAAIDRIVYFSNPLDATDPMNVNYLNLWFERGEYDLATGLFVRNDTSGTDLRITVLDAAASTTILDMFDVNGTILKDYAVDMTVAGVRRLPDVVDVTALLAIMQPFATIPTGSMIVPASIAQQVDTVWGFNDAPTITLTTPGIDPNNVYIAEGGFLDLTFDVSDSDDPDGSLTVTAHRMTSNAVGEELFPIEISQTFIDDNTRIIRITPTAFLSGSEEIAIRVSDGGVETSLNFNVTVDPVAQLTDPVLESETLATNEGAPIALGITASSNDPDGSENITVEINGVPGGGTLSAGTEDQVTGIWTLTESQLTGLTLTPPAGSGNEISLSVIAIATDGTSVTRSPAKTLNIDVNGKPTDIILDNTTINEAVTGDVVGILTTTDVGETGPYTYSIVGGVDSGNFEIGVGNQLKLKSAVTLDYENANDKIQDVIIRSTDPGGLYVDKTYSLTVTNLDEKPTQPAESTVTYNENALVSVALTGAVDPEGGDVDYSFSLVGGSSGNAGGLFHIVNDGTNAATLERAAGQELDFEVLKNQSYFHLNNANQGYLDVQFVATDLDVTDPNIVISDLRKSALQTVRVTVNDLNDEVPNKPTLSTQHLSSRNENSSSGVNGIKVATLTNQGDPDGETPSLRVKPGTVGAGYFEIKNGNEVWIKANQAFNYEALGGAQTIQVEAWDGIRPSTSTENITFTINNVNEPFNLVASKTFSAVSEFAGVNSSVGTISATGDPDSGAFGSFKYQFVTSSGTSGISQDGKFAINATTGAIIVNGGLDYETTTQHSYQVKVWDNNGNAGANSKTATVNIPVANVNEAPQFNVDPTNLDMGSIYDTYFDDIPIYSYDINGDATIKAVLKGVWTIDGQPLTLAYWNSVGIVKTGDIYWYRISSGYYRPEGLFEFDIEITDASGDVSRGRFISYNDTPMIFPVALDLDGDGVELISVDDSKVKMDVNGDGQKDKIGWISGDDAWLALDRNGSGDIDAFDEISFINDTPGATTDLEGLVIYDTNGNGLLDEQDARFNEFLVWQDANENGKSTKGELKTLGEAGIRAIELTPTPTGDTVEGATDNVITGFSRYLTTDGQFGEVGDVALAAILGRQHDNSSSAQTVTGFPVEKLDPNSDQQEQVAKNIKGYKSQQVVSEVSIKDASNDVVSDQAVHLLRQSISSFGGSAAGEFKLEDRDAYLSSHKIFTSPYVSESR